MRGDFILKKIAVQEEIKVLDEDLNNGFARIAKQYNMTVPEVKGYFKNRDDMLPFMNELLNEKILKFLRNEAKYIQVDAEEKNETKKSSKVGSETAEESNDNKEIAGE